MRLAFIGGNGHHYLRGALKDPEVQIDAVAVAGDGRDNAPARKVHAGIAGAQWFDDPHQMFDRFRPDVVNVGAVYALNGVLAAAALERDIPVVCDKPVAGSWAQLDVLRSVCRCHAAPLVTEFDFRSRAECRAAREAVRAGRLGTIVLATAQKSYRFGPPGSRPAWYARRADYTGTLMWIGCHGIDAIHFTTGLRFTSVFGRQGNLSRPDYGEMEDHTVAVFGLEGGATGLVHADYLRPEKAPTHGDDRLRLAGSAGLLEMRDGRCKLIRHDQEETDITDTVRPQPVHRDLLAALRGETDRYSTAASLYLAEVLLHARDAADGQKVVEIPR